MGEIVSGTIEVDRLYTVSGMEPVLDSARCPLDPTEATVNFRAYRGSEMRAWYVLVKGRRLRGEKTKGTFNQGGFTVLANGVVEPHYKNGPPPAWVQEVINRAIAEHAAGVGLIPAPVAA